MMRMYCNKIISDIETAMDAPDSALALALDSLENSSLGHGTCLLLDHAVEGDALYAGPAWDLSKDDTLGNLSSLTLTEIRNTFGFHRISVLISPDSLDATALGQQGRITAAAIDVIQAIGEIAEGISHGAADLGNQNVHAA